MNVNAWCTTYLLGLNNLLFKIPFH